MAGKPVGIKRAGAKTAYTSEQLVEIAKCMQDPAYFISNYCYVQHPAKGEIPFKLYPYQIDMVRTFQQNRLSVVLSPRQSGKSQTSGAYLLWYAIFHPDKTVLIASNKNSNAMEMIHRAQFMYERLPDWIKPGVEEFSKHHFTFENGSRILSQATTENTGRGLSISLLFLDEMAFVPPNIQELLWTSLSPTLATGGSMIISSTPNGDVDVFAEIWRQANTPVGELGGVGLNGFMPIRVNWMDPPGRDNSFKDREIEKIGETKWKQEYECEFISSDPLLIDTLALQRLTSTTQGKKPVADFNQIKLYEHPKPGATYLIGVDPATGSGEDFSAIQVFRFPEMVQAAEFRSNTLSAAQLHFVLKKLLRMYDRAGTAQVFYTVENNGVGDSLITLIENDEDPVDTAEFVSEDGSSRRGVATTGKSKIRSCISLKDLLEKDHMQLNSPHLVHELKTFVRSKGSYAAQRGATDDLVMATVIVMRLLEEIASFDEIAYDRLYVSSLRDLEDADKESADDDYNPADYISFG